MRFAGKLGTDFVTGVVGPWLIAIATAKINNIKRYGQCMAKLVGCKMPVRRFQTTRKRDIRFAGWNNAFSRRRHGDGLAVPSPPPQADVPSAAKRNNLTGEQYNWPKASKLDCFQAVYLVSYANLNGHVRR